MCGEQRTRWRIGHNVEAGRNKTKRTPNRKDHKLLRITDGERLVLDRDARKDTVEVAMDLNGLE